MEIITIFFLIYLSLKESLGEEHYETDELEVRHDADDRSEQSLDRLWQLGTTCVPRVHRDEDAYFVVQHYLLTFKLQIIRSKFTNHHIFSILQVSSSK